MHPRDHRRYLADIASWVDDPDSTDEGYTDRQVAISGFMQQLVGAYGKFDQTLGPDNAHYTAPSPLTAEGLTCGKCAYFEDGMCGLVNGTIDPGGFCQYILIAGTAPAEDTRQSLY